MDQLKLSSWVMTSSCHGRFKVKDSVNVWYSEVLPIYFQESFQV